MESIDIGTVTFGKGCEEYLAFKINTVKESTYYNYKFAIEKHLKPDLGSKTLLELINYDFNIYIKNKKEELDTQNDNEYKPNIADLITRLKNILKFLKQRYRDFKIELELIQSQRNEQGEIEVFSDKERIKLSKYLAEPKELKYIGILISLYSGLRIGEVCGLKWSDIDFENQLIYVQRTVQRVYLGKNKSKLIITSPKSKKSKRKVPISKVILQQLKMMSKEYSKDAFIVTGQEDKFTEPLVYRYTYKKVLNECNISYKKFHCLRHTFATRCIRVGMDIKSLSEVLGHSNIGITLAIYVHSSYEVKKKYIDKL